MFIHYSVYGCVVSFLYIGASPSADMEIDSLRIFSSMFSAPMERRKWCVRKENKPLSIALWLQDLKEGIVSFSPSSLSVSFLCSLHMPGERLLLRSPLCRCAECNFGAKVGTPTREVRNQEILSPRMQLPPSASSLFSRCWVRKMRDIIFRCCLRIPKSEITSDVSQRNEIELLPGKNKFGI